MRDLEERLDADYGKVPKEEYQAIVDELKKPKEKLQTTLREDYEVGIYQGEFFVDYSGRCDVCGFEYQYEFKDTNILKH